MCYTSIRGSLLTFVFLWREICLKKVAKAYNMIYKHKLSFTNVWNDLCVTFEDSTHKYKGVWAQVKLFHKYVHLNWYWSLMHNILSLAQKSFWLLKTFLCVQMCKTTRNSSVAPLQNFKCMWTNRLIRTDHVACPHLRQIECCQLVWSASAKLGHLGSVFYFFQTKWTFLFLKKRRKCD